MHTFQPVCLKYVTHFGGRLIGERGFSLSSSFFSLVSRGGRILGLSFSSRFIRSRSHSSFRRILSFSRSLSLSRSLSRWRLSLSRWSRSLSRSRFRSRGSRSRSRSCWDGSFKKQKVVLNNAYVLIEHTHTFKYNYSTLFLLYFIFLIVSLKNIQLMFCSNCIPFPIIV